MSFSYTLGQRSQGMDQAVMVWNCSHNSVAQLSNGYLKLLYLRETTLELLNYTGSFRLHKKFNDAPVPLRNKYFEAE